MDVIINRLIPSTATLLGLVVSLSGTAHARVCHDLFTTSTPLTLARVSDAGLPLEQVARSAVRIKKATVPSHQANYLVDLIVMNGVFDPTVYSGSHNMLRTVIDELGPAKSVLIIGTGSGYEALGLSLAKPDLKVHATDISERAVLNTQLNAEFYLRSSKISAWQSDLFSTVDKTYDIIIFHAPRAADASLDNGRIQDVNFFDADAKIRTRFLTEAHRHLRSQGRIFLLTESHFAPPSSFSATKLLTAAWSPHDPREGDYSIFRLQTK